MHISEDVIRPRWITSSEICMILPAVRGRNVAISKGWFSLATESESEFLLQDGESFAEQFKQKLKLSRQLYKQPFVYTTTWDRQTLLLTVQLASLTASMIQEIFCQESGAESLQLMNIPVLFATYLLQEEPDIAIMLWMSGRLWKPMLIQTKVLFPGNGITFVNEVPSVNPRFTEDIISDLYPHVNLLLAFNVCDKPFSL